ncbi:MAG TPA: FeoA family protein [Candidatus Hydrogenedentes bacterium]|nr:FeoA family protein [Candidatus Hydrogenedentota bacterium]HPU97878.1 FeoA family protein [Candidatus Hydrogenedentota bacterium]
MTLYDLNQGEWARVKAVYGGRHSHGIRRRLLDMGITTGTELRVERHAPLGDPMEIVVKDYRLALRLEEARHIEVERIAPPQPN